MPAYSSQSFVSISSTATGTTMTSPPDSVRCRPVRISASCSTTTERLPPSFTSHRIASPYEVLGIRSGATCQEIKSAYRRLARVLHPDVASHGDGMGREFMMVHEAYATLSDPDKRADYDRAMGEVGSRAGFVSGFRTRRWETDQCW